MSWKAMGGINGGDAPGDIEGEPVCAGDVFGDRGGVDCEAGAGYVLR